MMAASRDGVTILPLSRSFGQPAFFSMTSMSVHCGESPLRRSCRRSKILFKQELKNLENVAGSMPVLNEELTGHKNIRKVNVRNYIIFYIVDEEKSKAFVLRIGHIFMDWEKYLKDE